MTKNNNSKIIRTGWHPIDVAALERMRKPDYHHISRGLTLDSTPTDKAKYEIQQNILRYKRENNLSEKEIGKMLGIKSAKKLECLLFAHIENFSLDELFSYAEKLTIPLRIINEEETTKKNGRSRKHL